MASRQINLTLGTAGHIDHGKTALVKLLTGCETDRLKEERERGMSIDLGFAPCQIADFQVGIVDVPGHENFIKTMVAGAAGMDAVMLVVAADDGVMPQTREHMDILTLLGVRAGIVALSKIDRVDAEHREAVAASTRAFLRGTFLEDAPICPVSSITGEGLDAFLTTLNRLVASLQPKSLEGVFRMPIDRAFSARGFGTIVAGIPTSGSARVDDELVLLPEGAASRIRQIEVYGEPSDVVRAGQCAAVNVRHWDAHSIHRGHVVAQPGFFEPHQWFLTRLRLLDRQKLVLKNGIQVKLHTGTSEVTAGVYLLEGDRIEGGGEYLVQFHTQSPIVAAPGDHFIVRALSPAQTIGGGALVEGLARRQKRGQEGVLDDLRRRGEVIGEGRRFVEYAVEAAPDGAADEEELARRTKTLPERVREILAELAADGRVREIAPGLFAHHQTLDRLGRRLVELVEGFHRQQPASPGIAAGALRHESALSRPVVEGLLRLLAADGRLVEHGGRWALAGHEATFAGEDARRLDAIEDLFRQTGFRPPGMDELCDKTSLDATAAQRLLAILVEHGQVVRVEEGLYFHHDAFERARAILLEYLGREGRLESVQFKYLLDTTRKFAIPLLDHFDRVGVTRRVGNTRYLKKT